ncbi:Protein kinase rad3 [Frankliniella fusca]|uniref:Protein kinase rad3 n=1 Tax=Frankliniella fusca TaxID=407009 RepID=A0AAE1GYG6_9NEOP|nr:Protein kinase rad3 [Frankliniella fusca]
MGQRGVSFKKVDKLLVGLNVLYPELPKSHTVLLKSPNLDESDFVNIGEGLLWYKGLAANLEQRLTAEYLLTHDEIVVDINIDGLDLFKSAKLCFWPILGCLKGQRAPFIIACYCGEGHPDDLETFLQQFIEEASDLQENGFEFASTKFPFQLRNFILDAPARALIKCCVGHTGKVQLYNRIVFVGVEEAGELQTDDSFLRREQPDHHKGTSPLERDLEIPMVSAFRLDSMHLLHSGVFKRWVLYLLGDLHRKETAEETHIREMNRAAGVRQPRFRPQGKISAAAKNSINNTILEIAPSVPSDFNRRPRSLLYVHFFKSTEWRRMLLYDGIRIFKNNIPPNAFKNFLLLHCGSYILSSPQLVRDERMITAAELILNEFVASSV